MDYLSIPGGKKTTGNNNIFGKLTFALTPEHVVSATVIRDASFPQTGGTGLPEMNEERTTEDLIFRLNYKGILERDDLRRGRARPGDRARTTGIPRTATSGRRCITSRTWPRTSTTRTGTSRTTKSGWTPASS